MRLGYRLPSIQFLPSYTRQYHHIHRSNSDMTTVNKTTHPFDKTQLEALLSRRFFYAPAFEIYGGTWHAILLDIYSSEDSL